MQLAEFVRRVAHALDTRLEQPAGRDAGSRLGGGDRGVEIRRDRGETGITLVSSISSVVGGNATASTRAVPSRSTALMVALWPTAIVMLTRNALCTAQHREEGPGCQGPMDGALRQRTALWIFGTYAQRAAWRRSAL